MRDYRIHSKKRPVPEYVKAWNQSIAPIIAAEHKRLNLEDDDEPLIVVDFEVYGAMEWAYPAFVQKYNGLGIDVEYFKTILQHYLTGSGN